MIHHTTASSDTQARYIRNNNGQRYFTPDPLDYDREVPKTDQHRFDHQYNHQFDHQYDHMIPPMKKALKFTAKATWFLMKNMVKAAFLIPRLFSGTASKPSSKKNPSPATAFPAP